MERHGLFRPCAEGIDYGVKAFQVFRADCKQILLYVPACLGIIFPAAKSGDIKTSADGFGYDFFCGFAIGCDYCDIHGDPPIMVW